MLNAADDGGLAGAELGGQLVDTAVGGRDGNAVGRQLLRRNRAAAQIGHVFDNFRHRDCFGIGDLRGHPLGAVLEVFQRRAQQLQERNRLLGLVGIAIQPQGRGQRRQRDLIDAQRPHHRVTGNLLQRLAAADDDAALRPAEQLVAAEQHDVGAGLNTVGRDRFVGESVFGEVDHRPRADVVDHRQPMSAAQSDHFFQRHLGSETHDRVVAGVNPHQCGRVVVDRLLVIRPVRLVRSADLVEPGTAGAHHVGQTETAADFDQLAARDDHFAIRSQRGQDQHRRPGVVIHHDSRLGAG